MKLRRQLPAYSPIAFSALYKGLLGALGRSGEHELRAQLQNEFSAQRVVLTDSGTSALTAAIKAVIEGSDSLIAMPAYACYDLATAAAGANAQVVLYDVDPLTLAPEPRSFARALENACAAVIVHLYGVVVDVEQLRAVAERSGVVIIEDAAQAMGAAFRGRRAGSAGSFAILSFGRGKGLSGDGGGALLANDAKPAELLDRLNLQLPKARAGWRELFKAAAQWLLSRPALYGLVARLPFLNLGETTYHPPCSLHALSRASSRLVLARWPLVDNDADARRSTAAALLPAAHGGAQWRAVTIVSESTPGYLRLPVLRTTGEHPLIDAAGVALGVMPGYPLPLHRLAALRARCVNVNDEFPGAELLAQRLVTLPAHSLVSSSDVGDLEQWLSAADARARVPQPA